jgi:predicted metal-dependent hydrolase
VGRAVLQAGPYEVDLTRKNIQRAYLRVNDPAGPVRVSAPARMTDAQVAAFVQAQAAWIERRRAELRAAPAASARTGPVDAGGNVLLWGSPMPLESLVPRAVRLLAPGEGLRELDGWSETTAARVEKAVLAALRAELAAVAEPLVRAWEPRVGVRVDELRYRDMATRWGTCSVRAHRVWLALALAHFNAACTELIVVHELCHLVEANHGPRFKELMDRHLPDWREREALLRRSSRGGA